MFKSHFCQLLLRDLIFSLLEGEGGGGREREERGKEEEVGGGRGGERGRKEVIQVLPQK